MPDGAGPDPNGHAGALPNVLIIGAAKCGTTSLHRYLDLHPQISMAREKELHFFVEERTWRKGLSWYSRQFDPDAPFRGESSVTYTAHPARTGVAARIHSTVPSAKLLYIVRDPVKRILSAYMHRFSDGTERRPLREALLELEGNDLVERSRFFYQLEQYAEFFDRSSILVVSLDRLRAETQQVMSAVYEFVGADPDFVSSELGEVWNPTAAKRRKGPVARALHRLSKTSAAQIVPPDLRRQIGAVLYRPFSRPIEPPTLDPQTAQRLRAFLAPDAAKLRAWTGEPFPEWSV